MWMSYTDSEVGVYHPICEESLNDALVKLKLDDIYEVKHHEYTGSLEMDFVIKNKITGKYFCVVEVKRTPADVNSARYQFQAMSYVQSNSTQTEKPFYLVTNLENTYVFRFDKNRTRVVQQILEPGLISIGKFEDFNETEFKEKLTETFISIFQKNIIENDYNYSHSLDEFQQHMFSVSSKEKEWKSSLVFLLYEYIRGVFNELHVEGFKHDVRRFNNNIRRICSEAIQVNFNEIFNQPSNKYEIDYIVDNYLLEEMYKSGMIYGDGNYIADLLHEVASEGKENEGEVPTDLELSRFLSILAKHVSGELNSEGVISDPAAGSGNLITSAIDIFGITPDQIKANDINTKLLELLSLRMGLNNAHIISPQTSPTITALNIVDLKNTYFDDVEIILLNPPYVAGIYSGQRKKEIFDKIEKITNQRAITDVGQIGLEAPFIELISTLSQFKTTLACIIPVNYLTGRGPEAVAFRNYLLKDFGLELIFTYPSNGLFENVTKKTCVVIGKKGTSSNHIKILSAYSALKDIDVNDFSRELENNDFINEFVNLVPGIDIRGISKDYLETHSTDGWRGLSSMGWNAVELLQENFVNNKYLIKMNNLITENKLQKKRGWAGNSGASNLVFLDRNSDVVNTEGIYTVDSMRTVRNFNDLIINNGDFLTIDYAKSDESAINNIIQEYLKKPQVSGRQLKHDKSLEELKEILKRDSSKIINGYKLLLPRLVRPVGKVFYSSQPAVISTNFSCYYSNDKNYIQMLVSWTSTIFYQLICEISSKDQEGGRKMEMKDYDATYFPKVELLNAQNKKEILEDFDDISFKDLNNPVSTKTDLIWAKILFDNPEYMIEKCLSAVEFLANERNPV